MLWAEKLIARFHYFASVFIWSLPLKCQCSFNAMKFKHLQWSVMFFHYKTMTWLGILFLFIPCHSIFLKVFIFVLHIDRMFFKRNYHFWPRHYRHKCFMTLKKNHKWNTMLTEKRDGLQRRWTWKVSRIIFKTKLM